MVESKEVKKNLIDKRLLTQRSHVPRHGKALECLRGQGKSYKFNNHVESISVQVLRSYDYNLTGSSSPYYADQAMPHQDGSRI
jgi:hypothetical protein